MKAAEFSIKIKSEGNPMNSNQEIESKREKKLKPNFKPALDDTKPLLQDPILRADPVETEEAVLRLPPLLPLPITNSNSNAPK